MRCVESNAGVVSSLRTMRSTLTAWLLLAALCLGSRDGHAQTPLRIRVEVVEGRESPRSEGNCDRPQSPELVPSWGGSRQLCVQQREVVLTLQARVPTVGPTGARFVWNGNTLNPGLEVSTVGGVAGFTLDFNTWRYAVVRGGGVSLILAIRYAG